MEEQNLYCEYVANARKFKNTKAVNKDTQPFIEIGEAHCSYKNFKDSLRPREELSSEVMDIWAEDFNKREGQLAKKNKLLVKKYAFSCYLAMNLIVDPKEFKSSSCMRAFKRINKKFSVLDDDLLFFPVVKNNHWIVCCFNLLRQQFNIFDSMKSDYKASILETQAMNLFRNFSTLVKDSEISEKDFGNFKHFTPDHPKQKTIFDRGFFCMLFMEYYDSREVVEYRLESIIQYRKIVAARLIKNRENKVDLTEIMEKQLKFV